MKSHKIQYLLIMILGTSMVIAYQNCGGELGEIGRNSQLVTDPFPYELSLNTIAYQSCDLHHSDSGPQASSAYFTFKILANSNSENQGSSAIYLSRNLKDLSLSEKQKVLEDAKKVKNTGVRFSLKHSQNFEIALNLDHNRSSYSPLIMPIHDQNAKNSLAFMGSYNINGNSAALDLRTFNDADGNFINNFKPATTGSVSEYMLTLDYFNFNNPSKSLVPFDFGIESDKTYGNAYNFNVQRIANAGNGRPQLTNVYEKHLANDSDVSLSSRGTTWTCNSYPIIRTDETNPDFCGDGNYQNLPTSGGDLELIRLARLLDSSWQYKKDGTRICLKRQNGQQEGCYRPTLSSNPVQYASSSSCTTNPQNTSQMLCHHLMSVCYKNNFDSTW